MHTIGRLALNTLPLMLALLGAAACSGADPTDSDHDTTRGPISKAAAQANTCLDNGKSYCGGQSAGSCWCDDACTSYGDCCGDYTTVCTTPSCPDPTSPDVVYVNNSYKNPLACTNIYFACEAGQTPFSDDCGCGCIGSSSGGAPPTCPDPNDPGVTYLANSYGKPENCATILFTCDQSETPFSNDCGCGCIDNEPSTCPDPSDPKVHYVNNSYQDPIACSNILFACEPGQTPFSNDCGCGCVDP